MTHDDHDPGDEDRTAARWPAPGMKAWLSDLVVDIVSDFEYGRFLVVDANRQAYVAHGRDLRPYP
jgi:hypothetical protein